MTGDTAYTAADKLEDNIDDVYTNLNELKDTFLGSSAPSAPDAGQIWLDNSVSGYYIAKVFDGSDWTRFLDISIGWGTGACIKINSTGEVSFPIGLKTDTINEKTADAGVTIDSTLIWDKTGTATASVSYPSEDAVFRGSGWDGTAEVELDITLRNIVDDAAQTYRLAVLDDTGTEFATFQADTATFKIDTIEEKTAGVGVTLDGALVKDGVFINTYADKINLTVQRNATNPTYQIDIDADYLVVENVGLASIDLTASIDVSGANGLDTGTEATSTWYSVWVICDDDGSSVASLLSTSATAPTMPTGYTKKRRIGWVYNDDSGDFVDFYRAGDFAEVPYLYVLDTSSPATNWTDVSCASVVPPTAKGVGGFLRGIAASSITGGWEVQVRSDKQVTNVGIMAGGNDASEQTIAPFFVMCVSQTIEYKTNDAANATISICYYYDPV